MVVMCSSNRIRILQCDEKKSFVKYYTAVLIISYLCALVFLLMIDMFVAETPLSDADKAMLLVVFVVIGEIAIIGLVIWTNFDERWVSPFVSSITLCVVLFLLGIYQLALGFFPQI